MIKDYATEARQAERMNDLRATIRALRILIEHQREEWPVVLRTGNRWLRVAKREKSIELAAHAANVYRLLAPVAGLCVECGAPVRVLSAPLFGSPGEDTLFEPGTVMCTRYPLAHRGEAPTNPLHHYIEALKVWAPEEWFDWLHLRVCDCNGMGQGKPYHDIVLGSYDASDTAEITREGWMRHGLRCKPLPHVPPDPQKTLK